MNTADELDTLQIGPDPDKLERFHRQQLSAMLDGELSQDQARFLRRRLEHDAELSSCFERWQVCGDVLRGRQVSLLPPDFADRIARGIAEGDVVVAPVAVSKRPRLLRWGGGAALAASVALVALFVGRPGAVLDEVEDVRPLAADNASAAPAPVAALDATADALTLSFDTRTDPAATDAGSTALAIAEAPRRAGGERASRGQSQRAAMRSAQRRADMRAVAAAPAERAIDIGSAPAAPVSSHLIAGNSTVEAALPAAVARPWPKASSLSANSSFSVRYGEPFEAPSWGHSQPVGSAVLPRFPVEADTSARSQIRALP